MAPGQKDNILQELFNEGKNLEYQWVRAMAIGELNYKRMIKYGANTQLARGGLPLDLKTEIITTANLREWRHIFNLRCSQQADPQFRELLLPMLEEFNRIIPVIFEDIKEKYL